MWKKEGGKKFHPNFYRNAPTFHKMCLFDELFVIKVGGLIPA